PPDGVLNTEYERWLASESEPPPRSVYPAGGCRSLSPTFGQSPAGAVVGVGLVGEGVAGADVVELFAGDEVGDDAGARAEPAGPAVDVVTAAVVDGPAPLSTDGLLHPLMATTAAPAPRAVPRRVATRRAAGSCLPRSCIGGEVTQRIWVHRVGCAT